VPWHHFNSPATRWAEQPTFVVGELLFIGLAALALIHARKNGRKYVLAWIAALVAGTANDVIFMALPLVDNFWQAQAMVMLTARMPLYIPCVYVCFMYYPTVALWRLDLPPFGRALATGLTATVFYGPYDLIGAKFLWWTWHDSDPLIAARILGVPIGSTMWVASFVASFAFLLDRGVARDPAVAPRTFVKTLALVAGLSTLLMVLQMTPLRQLDGGTPGPRSLAALLGLYVIGVALSRRRGDSPPASDHLLHRAVLVYFATLALIAALGRPETHVATGVHQTYGACNVAATDVTGLTRNEYLCAADFDEDFTFDCAAPPAEGTRWYTLCGRAHRHFALWLGLVAALAATGAALFSWLLLGPRKSRR
jgi:hypothetical protein